MPAGLDVDDSEDRREPVEIALRGRTRRGRERDVDRCRGITTRDVHVRDRGGHRVRRTRATQEVIVDREAERTRTHGRSIRRRRRGGPRHLAE